MSSKEGKTSRMTLQQREVMLAFMKAHENFAKGKISNLGPDGARVKASLVKDLAAELNSLPNGATKSGDKWMKSWQDWRSDVKAKAAKIKKALIGTGGGPPTTLVLTTLEEELIAFLGKVVAEGVKGVIDPLEAEEPSPSTTTQEVGSTEKERIYILNEEGVLEDYVPSPAVFETEVENTQSFSSVATPSLPRKEKKRKHRRSEAPASAPSTSKEMPSDKLLKLSVEQTDLLRRKVEAKEEMVALQRESLLLQGRQAVAIENAAASFTDTMKMVQDAIKKWLDKD